MIMNLLHLKYMIEVDKYGSISKAATHLYLNQPRLSKIIKEIEAEMNIKIFERNSKGVTPTKKGRQFLDRAISIVSEVEALENMYHEDSLKTVSLNISVPRVSYISEAFIRFLRSERIKDKDIDINYRETNTEQAISNINEGEDHLGIIRIPVDQMNYYENILALKGIKWEELFRFHYLVLMSKDNVLANKNIYLADLYDQIELIHGDSRIQDQDNPYQQANKTIKIYERASQYEILRYVKDTYIWASPLSKEMLDAYGLILKECLDQKNEYIDLVIYRKGYNPTSEEGDFIRYLHQLTEQFK
ncbi:LysR family transcriptional regulator [Erysipelatoclostridium sp. AM42-17]|nr:LysR family transcriptional regulator [Coprobacillus sp. AF33-1AC]RHS96091.1 LysR family transcriptional regulator [Erysipelatoclostridium sp. AM42-17]